MAMCCLKFAYSSHLLSSGSSRTFSFPWGFPFLVQKSFKSSGRQPKKKIYNREHDLDRIMGLQKKPSLILQLKNIILNQKNRCILLGDLEKEVGKWNFMSIIERCSLIFEVTGGSRRPYVLQLTDKALSIAEEEKDVMEMMEPIVVTNIRKLLMMSMDCRIPLAKFVLIQPKQAVSVLHELLSLTVEKRLTSAQLDAFHAEYQLPCTLLLCRNHAIFYLANKGIRSTIMLKEVYDGSCLIEKSPLVRFNDKFLALSGRSEHNLKKRMPLTVEVV